MILGFVPGCELGLRTDSNRRLVCGRRARPRSFSRSVIRMVVEPPSKKDSVTAPPEKEEKEREEEVSEIEKEVEIIVPKRTSFAGLVYDRLLDTGADVAMHLGRMVRKPVVDKKVERPRLVILGSGKYKKRAKEVSTCSKIPDRKACLIDFVAQGLLRVTHKRKLFHNSHHPLSISTSFFFKAFSLQKLASRSEPPFSLQDLAHCVTL